MINYLYYHLLFSALPLLISSQKISRIQVLIALKRKRLYTSTQGREEMKLTADATKKLPLLSSAQCPLVGFGPFLQTDCGTLTNPWHYHWQHVRIVQQVDALVKYVDDLPLRLWTPLRYLWRAALSGAAPSNHFRFFEIHCELGVTVHLHSMLFKLPTSMCTNVTVHFHLFIVPTTFFYSIWLICSIHVSK